jgi:hypothetical protein
MADLIKALTMIAMFVLPVVLVALAVVCLGRCIPDMLDDREHSSSSAEQPPT